MRIVSLLPSATEIVAALGCADNLVGRSHECDFPASVRNLAVCTRPKIPIDGNSRDIDAQVKRAVSEGLSVYRVESETLKALAPDVIITQSQCDVCAVSEDELRQEVAAWVGYKPEIVSLEPSCLSDIWNDIEQVGDAIGVPEKARGLTEHLRTRTRDIAVLTHAVSEQPRTACIEWLDPLMSAGNWVPELVELAGGENLFGKAGLHSPWMEWDALASADPDVILLMPCGFDLTRTREEARLLAAHPGWQSLSAVVSGRVYAVDGNRYFNRPGPAIVESLEIMAEALHSDEFDFGHRNTGWQPLGQI